MKEKIIVGVLAIAVIVVIFSTDISDSVLGQIMEQYTPPDWSEVQERNIVKNSIPISVIEKSGNDCLVNAENFEHIIDHRYFKRSEELVKELHYNKEDKTLLISCNIISEESSQLHVWYATSEALMHSEKYEYFITTKK